MNVYPTGLDAILSGDVDLLVDTIKAVLVTDGYVYSATHDFLDDVGAPDRISTATLSGKSVASGVFYAADTTWTAPPSGDTVAAIVIYRDSGLATSSQLLAYIERKADTSSIDVDTNDANITAAWVGGKVFRI